MNKQIFFGFAIIAAAAIMLTSQIPEAYAADLDCIDETLTGNINANITVSTQSSFNICVIDGATITGSIVVEANAAVFIYDGSVINGNVALQGEFSAVNFEGIDTNIVNGNILGIEDTYVYLDSVTISRNLKTSGEVYFSSSSSRFSGPVTVEGNINISPGTNTNEFVLASTVLGHVVLDKQLSVRIFDAEIGGNLIIGNSTNTSSNNSFINITSTSIGGNLMLESNSLSTILISDNVVGGNLLLKENDSPITIENNTIDGNGNCEDNQSVSGSGNNFVGKSKGKQQCKKI